MADKSIPTGEAPMESAPTQSKQQGRGAKNRKFEKFRGKKNQEFQAQLTASLLKRLHVADPTSVSAIRLRSSVAPAAVPITLRALPRLVHAVWMRMISIGTRPFGVLATQQNYGIFLKIILMLAEAKVAYAQIKCTSPPNIELEHTHLFSEAELRVFTSISRVLPYPIAIYLEAIGSFTIDRQNVVPYLPRLQPAAVSGCVTYAPTHIREVLNALAQPVAADNANVVAARAIDDLPNVDWQEVQVPIREGEAVVQRPGFRASPASLEFWNQRLPTVQERTTFRQIISAMDSKKGFNILSSIEHGEGSLVQVIRFPEQFDPTELDTTYYSNVALPSFEEQLAPALMLGYEYGVPRYSRFMSGYDECLVRGIASQEEAVRSVVWTNTE